MRNLSKGRFTWGAPYGRTEIRENAYIQEPYHAMWGGWHVHLGKNVYINYNCTLADDAHIY